MLKEMDLPENKKNNYGHGAGTSIEEAVHKMAGEMLFKKNALVVMYFAMAVERYKANPDSGTEFALGFVNGFEYALKEILSGRLQLKMFEIDKP
jgi:hypothetical protein